LVKYGRSDVAVNLFPAINELISGARRFDTALDAGAGMLVPDDGGHHPGRTLVGLGNTLM
jgi:hypothetical protein